MATKLTRLERRKPLLYYLLTAFWNNVLWLEVICRTGYFSFFSWKELDKRIIGLRGKKTLCCSVYRPYIACIAPSGYYLANFSDIKHWLVAVRTPRQPSWCIYYQSGLSSQRTLGKYFVQVTASAPLSKGSTSSSLITHGRTTVEPFSAYVNSSATSISNGKPEREVDNTTVWLDSVPKRIKRFHCLDGTQFV